MLFAPCYAYCSFTLHLFVCVPFRFRETVKLSPTWHVLMLQAILMCSQLPNVPPFITVLWNTVEYAQAMAHLSRVTYDLYRNHPGLKQMLRLVFCLNESNRLYFCLTISVQQSWSRSWHCYSKNIRCLVADSHCTWSNSSTPSRANGCHQRGHGNWHDVSTFRYHHIPFYSYDFRFFHAGCMHHSVWLHISWSNHFETWILLTKSNY